MSLVFYNPKNKARRSEECSWNLHHICTYRYCICPCHRPKEDPHRNIYANLNLDMIDPPKKQYPYPTPQPLKKRKKTKPTEYLH